MAQVINTNIASLNAQRNLTGSQTSLNTALQRLSTGLRINSAKDDAAGLAISSRMSTQINGLNQAARNASDAISLAQTAEGALGQIGDNLQRIRTLAVQSRNATNSPEDRAKLQKEVSQLISEIGRVAKDTDFNGTKLLDGSFNAQAFQVGANQGQTINISSIANANVDALGSWNSVGEATVVGGVVEPDADGGGFGYASTKISIGGKEVTLAAVDAPTADAAKGLRALQVANAFNSQLGAGAASVTGSGATLALSIRNVTTEAVAVAGLEQFGITATTLAAGTVAAAVPADHVSTLNVNNALVGGTATGSGTTNGFTVDARTISVNGVNIELDAITIGETHATAAAAQEAAWAAFNTDLSAKLTTVLGSSGTAVTGGTAAAPTITITNATEKSALTITGLGAAINLKARTVTPGAAAAMTQANFTASSPVAGFAAGSFTVNGTTINLDAAKAKGATLEEQSTNRLNYVRNQINAQSETTGVSASVKNGRLELSSPNDIVLVDGTGLAAGGLAQAGLTAGTTQAPVSEAKIGFADLDIGTVTGADNAILAIDAALNAVSESRANLGAIQNRFTSVVTNLESTSENLSAARSRIMDTDFAAETAAMTKNQILQQAGTAMLAQANSLPNNVLTLLRG